MAPDPPSRTEAERQPDDVPEGVDRARSRWRWPIGVVGTVVLASAICAAPLWLHADSLLAYRMHSDDFPYVAASRTLDRAAGNLFVPHNTHIVPAWRMLTWAVSATAGRLADLQATLAVATYGAVVLAMLAVGWLVARETGRASVGMAAMAALGTSSLMRSAATWYSAGQALWAGIGVLAMLLLLQSWRIRGGPWRLVLGSVAGAMAGWLWTVGYAAAPVGAVYLWADGRRRCRRGAALPMLVGIAAAGFALALGARSIDATVSFHGRTSAEALDPLRGIMHTIHAIAENLILGNLGVAAETTFAQASLIAAVVGLFWVANRARSGRAGPLEWAGASLVLISYAIEWSFRGYLPFESLRGVVPWYDTIPHVGVVLFASGWLSGAGREIPPGPVARPTRGGAVVVAAFTLGLLALHRPRVGEAMIAKAPAMSDEERQVFATPALQRDRAADLAGAYARWQRRHLAKLDQAEAAARQAGIGRDAIVRAFGRLDAPELPEVYDAVDLLALPEEGGPGDPNAIRANLSRYLTVEPPPTLPTVPAEPPPTEREPRPGS